VLLFACPKSNRRAQIVPSSRYKNQGVALLSNEFLEWLRSRARHPPSSPPLPGGGGDYAVVHIRRGDIDPCKQWKDRYLPSSYYVEVLDRYVPASIPVTVYSESASFEPWDDFALLMGQGTPRNWTLRLDAEATEVWRAVAAAKFIVLSVSSFAYVPALLNSNANAGGGAVVYAPHEAKLIPLHWWVQADRPILARARERASDLATKRCGTYKSVRSGMSKWEKPKLS
jgi:hypothetical protein